MNKKAKLPKCQVCGQEMVEGLMYPVGLSDETLYVCFDCENLIDAIVRNALPEQLRELADKAENPLRESFKAGNIKKARNRTKKGHNEIPVDEET